MTALRYQAVAAELAERYLAVPDGRKLPTELQLASEFSVARSTVRRALALLAEDGLVERRLGAGTFAARATPRPSGARFGALAHLAQLRAFDDDTQVSEDLVDTEIVPVPPALARIFPRPGTFLVASSRTVHVGGRVLGVLDAHTEPTAARAAALGSDEFGLAVPDDATFRVHVAVAGPRRGKVLEISSTTSVLISQRLAVQRGRIVELSTLAMADDLGEFVVRTGTQRARGRDPLVGALRSLDAELHG